MGRQFRSLTGKVVVITGGGRGIGAATAAALIQQNATVVIGDLDLEIAKKTAEKLGENAVALPLDVTDRPGFTAFLDEVESRFGSIDVLINNAGIMPLGPFDEETDRATSRLLEINLHAVIHGTREAVLRMRPRGRGHIINMASITGKVGFPGAATYGATKHGIVGLSEAVRWELRGSGVEVSVVMPAIVRTELASGLTEAKLFTSVEPTEVAKAIIRAIQRPTFDVFVPRALGPMVRLTRLLPRGMAEWMIRSFSGDQVLMAPERAARKDYEARAAASAPAMEKAAPTTMEQISKRL